mmetsp:Transcript_38297/g.92372  ORF Transcript_38297/g.92372 Transcript_38297/m.92372 type:complete len:777 (+) Transcript_38297:58-2388(+)|eukprot:CAMPEP_0181095640 /NCGR_PEP_ID=MMETSP1071-20121207/10618_1 /TAXON_ID=35127 /ORGANISM="Thalassiosira sp., Strain NH16" /LENGTH=776 /DNA_ID=CAMNT_0023178017 /DNA_START=35 /DNA_END=2365 /DNA_ORIENTATION=-
MPIIEKNIARRCFDQRGVLHQLLAASDRINIEATSEHQITFIWQLAACIKDGNVAHFPAYEFKTILSALKEECRGDHMLSYINDDAQSDCVSMDQPPRKRAKRSQNINLHSILKFVERIVDGRYGETAKCKTEEDAYLEGEMKCYFGTEDILFQTEEEIRCLAFEIALNAIIYNVEDSCHQNFSEACFENNKQDDKHGVPAHRDFLSTTLRVGVIESALKIIDSVVLIDRRERDTLYKIRQAKKTRQLSTDAISNRRKKYDHLLLQPNSKEWHEKRKLHEKNPGNSFLLKSVMEGKYPKQWEWLCQFRIKYEMKEKLHYPKSPCGKSRDSSTIDETTKDRKLPSCNQTEKLPGSNFVIVRRKVENLDDGSLSSNEANEEIDGELGIPRDEKQQHNNIYHPDRPGDIGGTPANVVLSQINPKLASAGATSASPLDKPISPYDKLARETYELRLTLLDMPPSESSSVEVVRHTVDEIGNLLSRYGELDGAAGITRCGDVLCGNCAIDMGDTNAEAGAESNASGQFPLNDTIVSALVKAFLTDATGALRAKSFLRSFVLPLMLEMNPIARAIAMGDNVNDQKIAKDQGKPASRVLTSLLASLARERPIECVTSVLVPSLVLRKHIPSSTSASEALFEPTRFQCELISRVLRGKDALSIPAITLLVEEVLPTKEGTSASSGVMKWTDSTMSVLTACLNRQPSLPDDVVAKLADEIIYHLSPKPNQSMGKSMKFSTLFHALVTKYGPQVKSTGRVQTLKDSTTWLKTFMSKTISSSLKKLS